MTAGKGETPDTRIRAAVEGVNQAHEALISPIIIRITLPIDWRDGFIFLRKPSAVGSQESVKKPSTISGQLNPAGIV